jgi:Na+/proline symporter
MFLASTIALFVGLVWIAIASARRASSVNDFVLAGQSIGVVAGTGALVATWYGAESLLTLSDEVARGGLKAIWIDPVGIALCLVLVGLFVVPRLYHLDITTVGDMFRQAAGANAERLASLVIVPSYFGWIAAQLIAASMMLRLFVGGEIVFWTILVSCVAFILCFFGGGSGVAVANAASMLVIGLGLLAMAALIVKAGVIFESDSWRVSGLIPSANLELLDREASSPWMQMLGALAVGSIGNIPAIELVQRIRSSRSMNTARWSCLLAAGIYLAMGCVPVLCGIAFLGFGYRMADDIQVLSHLAKVHMPTPGALALFLAILATILTTLMSAISAPATMLGINVIEPLWKCFRRRPMTEENRIRLQKWSIGIMLAGGLGFAWSGETAFELLRDSYGMLLAAIVVPFMAILIERERVSRIGVTSTILFGTCMWCAHWWFGWESLAGYWGEQLLVIPHELGASVLSLALYMVVRLQT